MQFPNYCASHRCILLVRGACCAYWCLLSLLLLHPDPLALIGLERLRGQPGGHGVHLVCFAGLAFLIAASRFPVRRSVLAAVLLGYAVVTEALQAFVPNRMVDSFDMAENVAGLVAGTVIWWIVWKGPRTWMPGATAADDLRTQESHDGEDQQAGCR